METAQMDRAPARAASILFGLGFTPEEQKQPTKEFSGGWRMRLALAKALFMRPDLLLLDEPTNMLDMRAIIWLENHLQEWTSTIVIVSHDRSFLNSVCTDIIHLHSKRLDQYKGNYAVFEKTMKEKLMQQERLLIFGNDSRILANVFREYEAQQQFRQHTQEFIDKFRYNAKRASMVQSRIKMLEKLPILKPVVLEGEVKLSFPECEILNNLVLQLDDVSFRYTSVSPFIFTKLQIGSHADSRICIVGENGAGKTTLLKLLLGELSPTSGFRNANRHLKIGYFSQHHVDQLDMNISGMEVLEKRFPGKTQEEYRAVLGRFGLSGDLALQSVVTLSGGQKSRLAFANIAMSNPNYLIMDEPTNHLDVETVEALGQAINSFNGGVLIVSHDEKLIDMVCKELWVVKDRSVMALEGGLEEYKRHVMTQLAL
uniref:ABC transporter domain-containing protein n=1 Tax=Setaria digitata TaxID=48799 RepID=A0A915Q752_9BILA